MKRLIIVLTALSAVLVFKPTPVRAQELSGDNGPIFESDRRKEAETLEAERAARRKTYEPVVYPKYMDGGERPDIKPAEPPIVYLDEPGDVGSIIVDTQNRKLYFILPGKKAYAYPISVGREGFTWSGTEKITRIAEWPSWTPPPEMRQRIPGLPITVSGGVNNPQGARALYLGNTVYRIHGTNNERTVGRANSSGCFRLANEHVVHLASIAKVGTTVRVLPTFTGGVSETAPLSSLFDFMSSAPDPAPKTHVKKAAQSKKSTDTTRTGASPPVPKVSKQPSSSQLAAPATATLPTPDAQAAAEAARKAASEAAEAAEAAKAAAAAAKNAAN